MPNQLGDKPIEERYRRLMIDIMAAVDSTLNHGQSGSERETGIIMLVFPYGDTTAGRCNFISNGADRRDVVVLMKEMIARFEGQPEVKGNA